MKKFFSKFKQNIISQNEYFKISIEEVYKRNLQLISTFCFFGIFIFVFIFLVSFIYDAIYHTNYMMNPIYFLAIIPLPIFFIINIINNHTKKIITSKNILNYTTLMYIVSMAIVMVFSIFVQPDKSSVYFPIFIICVPVFFLLPFFRKIIINTISIIVYVILAFKFKTCDLNHDVFEAIIAYIFSIFIIITMLNLRVQNVLIYNHYKNSSIHDNLTQTLNRSGGMDEMISYLKTVDDNEEYALAFIDLDNFKTINDTYGHVDGDKCLKLVASSLIEVTGSDILCRFGGDEFLLLIKNTSEKLVKDKLDYIQSILNNLSLKENRNLNCSMGVYLLRGKLDSINNLLDEADKALYEAKNSGKNQFIIRKYNK